MKFLFGAALYFSLLPRATWSQPIGSEPSPMEAFANRQGIRTAWSHELARWDYDGNHLVLTALVLEDSGQPVRKLRGVKIDLLSGSAHDQIYLDEPATERTRSALEEIANAVSPRGSRGSRECTGAKEFWPLYDWPWNKYHELNADFCRDGNTLALVLHGRGKQGSFSFPGKNPIDLAGILASAMQRLNQH
jgi:hypothetical protein